jgi:hypothetical protein
VQELEHSIDAPPRQAAVQLLKLLSDPQLDAALAKAPAAPPPTSRRCAGSLDRIDAASGARLVALGGQLLNTLTRLRDDVKAAIGDPKTLLPRKHSPP